MFTGRLRYPDTMADKRLQQPSARLEYVPISQLRQHDLQFIDRLSKDIPRMPIVTNHYGAHVRMPPFAGRISVFSSQFFNVLGQNLKAGQGELLRYRRYYTAIREKSPVI